MAQHSFAHLISSDVTIPEFLKRLQCSDVSEGEKAHLLCQVIGDPGKNIALLIFIRKKN
jgi:hypothetical protein